MISRLPPEQRATAGRGRVHVGQRSMSQASCHLNFSRRQIDGNEREVNKDDSHRAGEGEWGIQI